MDTGEMETDGADTEVGGSEHFNDPLGKVEKRGKGSGTKKVLKKRRHSSENSSSNEMADVELIAKATTKPVTQEKEKEESETTIIMEPNKEQEGKFFSNNIGVYRLLSHSIIGQAGIMTCTRNLKRKTYTIKIKNNERIKEILALRKLGMYEITVTRPKAEEALSFRYGVIGPFGEDIEADEIEEILKEDYDDVKVERIMRGFGEGRQKTTQMKVRFKASVFPVSVNILYERFQVRQFIDRPWQCYNCQGYGHSAKFCTKKQRCLVCAHSAGEHRVADCQVRDGPQKCVNCGGPHLSNSWKCQKMQKEKEIQKFKCNSHVTYSEAVKKMRENKEEQQKEEEMQARPGPSRKYWNGNSNVEAPLRRVDVRVSTREVGTQTSRDEATNTIQKESEQLGEVTKFEDHSEKQAAFLLELISSITSANTVQRKCRVLAKAYDTHFSNKLNVNVMKNRIESGNTKKETKEKCYTGRIATYNDN